VCDHVERHDREPRRQPSRGLVGFPFDGDPAVRGRCRERGVVALVLIGVRGGEVGDGAIHVLPAAEVAGDRDRSPERAWRPRLGGRLHTDRAGALLVFAALRNYVKRETVEPPKWLGALQAADAKKALTTGLMVILLMPSDIIIMLTVATNLEQTGSSFAEALPFIGLTVLVAVLPLLAFLLFHRRAQRAMPKVRDWMRDWAWAVNVIVCASSSC
jgi:Sap, sulfolipid-1-addressing protein